MLGIDHEATTKSGKNSEKDIKKETTRWKNGGRAFRPTYSSRQSSSIKNSICIIRVSIYAHSLLQISPGVSFSILAFCSRISWQQVSTTASPLISTISCGLFSSANPYFRNKSALQRSPYVLYICSPSLIGLMAFMRSPSGSWNNRALLNPVL